MIKRGLPERDRATEKIASAELPVLGLGLVYIYIIIIFYYLGKESGERRRQIDDNIKDTGTPLTVIHNFSFLCL